MWPICLDSISDLEGPFFVADHSAEQAHQDRRQGRATWPHRHIPARGGRCFQSAICRYPAPDWPAAAGSLAAMAGRGPESSGPPTEEIRLVNGEVYPPFPRLAAQRPFDQRTSQQSQEIAMRRANRGLSRLRKPNVLPLSVSWRCHQGHLG